MTQNVVIEVPSRINPGDIIIYDGKWIVMSKAEFLKGTSDTINSKAKALWAENEKLKSELKKKDDEIAEIKQEIATFKANVNKKFKEHHDVLNALTGGDK